MLDNSVSGEGPLPGFQIAPFSLCPHMEETALESLHLLIMALIPS